MPRVLTATPHASGNALTEASIQAVEGTFPGATTFPAGNDPVLLTVSGNEVTDATRAAILGTGSSGQMMDGRSNDSSFGIRRAATNLFRRGQCDTLAASDTGIANAGAGLVQSLDATTPPPFSTQSFKAVSDGTTANVGNQHQSDINQNAAAGTVGVGSVYFKGVAGQSYSCSMRWGNTDATTTVGTVLNFTATGAWQVVTPPSLAVAVGKTGHLLKIAVYINGTRAETFWTAHPMLEKGWPTVAPYVATSGGTTATHGGARVRAVASLVGTTQGWFAARVRVGWKTADEASASAFKFVAALNDSVAGTDSFQLFYRTASSDWRMRSQRSGGAQSPEPVVVISHNPSDVVTVVGYWTPTQIAVSVNGGAFVVTTPAAMPNFTSGAPIFDIGTNLTGSTLDGDLLWLACGAGVFTDNPPAALAAAGDNPSPTLFPSSLTALWYASTAALEGPDPSAYLYPGRGSSLAATAETPTTLTETAA